MRPSEQDRILLRAMQEREPLAVLPTYEQCVEAAAQAMTTNRSWDDAPRVLEALRAIGILLPPKPGEPAAKD